MQWYKHYLEDYDQDTIDLSFIQDAAYRRLLGAYYRREGPLQSDLKLLYRLVHAHSRHEQEAVRTMLARYFVLLDGHFTNTRADEEIKQYQAQCVANRRPNRQRIVNDSTPESTPRTERVERAEPPLPPTTAKPNGSACQHVMGNGQQCGMPGVHQIDRSNRWYCRNHPDG